MNKILAVDPGNEQSGFVLLDTKTYEPLMFGKISNAEMIMLTATRDYDHMVIEGIASYGMAVGKEVFATCFFSGRLFQIATARNVETVELLYRKDVKLNLCGSSKAKDGNIIQALKDRFGDKGTKKDPGFFYGFSKDAWQAMALAVTWIDREKKL